MSVLGGGGGGSYNSDFVNLIPKLPLHELSSKLLKGVLYRGVLYGASKGDTRSLDFIDF